MRYRIVYEHDTSGDWGSDPKTGKATPGPLEASIVKATLAPDGTPVVVHQVSWPFARLRARAWWLLHGGFLPG